MTRDDLRALVAVKLTDAGFEPSRASELMAIAFDYAAGVISLEHRGEFVVELKEGPDDDSHDD